MGLRFRKRIKLFKGVHLNIGKNGVSLSAGIPGFRKTIHSSGRVTTSVGIPGTGISYVETKNIKDKVSENRPVKKQDAHLWKPLETTYKLDTEEKPRPTESVKGKINSHGTSIWGIHTYKDNEKVSLNVESNTSGRINLNDNNNQLNVDYEKKDSTCDDMFDVKKKEAVTEIPEIKSLNVQLTDLFQNCDYPVKWIDVITEEKPTDENYNPEIWEYLRSKSLRVFEGDIAAMIDVIEHVNPYDDLLDYLTDFEFITDDAECLEINCTMIQNSLGSEKEDAAASVIIRLARDTFALLPVSSIRITIENAPTTILDDIWFERDTFAEAIFENKDPSDLLRSLCK